MRIYFAGSHSSGKSTLVRHVSEHYNLPIVPEAARLVLSEKELSINALRADIKMTDGFQMDVFNRQLLEEKRFRNFVSDRCLLDVIAYGAQHSRISSQLIASDSLKTYLDDIKSNGSIIFFIRPSRVTLKEDGVRESPIWDGVIAIDAQIKLLLEMYGVKYFQINTDNMQERIRTIDAVLSFME